MDVHTRVRAKVVTHLMANGLHQRRPVRPHTHVQMNAVTQLPTSGRTTTTRKPRHRTSHLKWTPERRVGPTQRRGASQHQQGKTLQLLPKLNRRQRTKVRHQLQFTTNHEHAPSPEPPRRQHRHPSQPLQLLRRHLHPATTATKRTPAKPTPQPPSATPKEGRPRARRT